LILSLLIWGVLLFAIFIGFQRPYAFALLYIWLDFFRPQLIAPKGFEGTSVTIVVGILAVVGLIANAPSRFKKPSLDFILLMLLAIWITLTSFSAVVQSEVWLKWDWAFKGLMFAALLGQFTAKREDFEAAILVMIAASLHQILSFTIKTVLGGGGYGIDLGVLGDQTTGMGESSTLAVYCASVLPIVVAFSRHSLIFPASRFRYWGSRALMVACLITPIGTYARTALLSLTISIAGLSIRRPAGFVVLAFAAIISVLAYPIIAETQWGQRMETTFAYQKNSSAMGRVAVWDWTIDFIKANPLGGGFFIDQTNQIVINVDSDGDSEGGQQIVRGKAFHSIYFEVLGEQGYPGFVLYFGIVLLSVSRLCRVWFGSRKIPNVRWEREMAYGFLVAWAALLVGAGFVGIAWLPLMFLMMAFSNCIYRFYVEKLELTDSAERRGSRGDIHEY